MTAYHGGKQRIGKRLATEIYNIATMMEVEDNFTFKGYCEPFVGMCGVYQHIPELIDDHRPRLKYKAGDTNGSVIKMWQATQKGWVPPHKSSETQYNQLKYASDSALRGYIGHQYSFGGQFFKGYAPKYGKTKNSKKASNNVVQIAEKLENVTFSKGPYTQFSNLKGYIIYCDPPYENTFLYYNKNTSDKFDNNDFWNWCRKMAQYNVVFVSGYNAPKDTECVFSSSHKLTGISPGRNNKKRVEKLYVVV